MKNISKIIFYILVFASFLVIAYFAYTGLLKKYKPETNANLVENTPEIINIAPDFTVYDKNNNKVKLSDFRGKPIILNFWASWCPPCKSEMPNFNKVYSEYKENVAFMMVDLVDGQRETKEKGQKYIEDQGYNFPVYFDIDKQAANAYKIISIPTTIFIDSKGKIISTHKGAISESTLIAEINKITK